MRRLFISDLHLEDKRPDITRALFTLLDRFSGQVDELYILGDLFEVWLGDDVLSDTAEQVSRQLKRFSDAGAKIFIMHGNRDFLLGNHYCQASGAELIAEPYFVQIGKRNTLLMHGDTLCVDDKLYMDFRNTVRNPEWQRDFLAKTVEQRMAFAKQARDQSQLDAKEKTQEILDVTPSEVERVMSEHDTSLFIHGHTHRPDRHPVSLNNQKAERIVLGDWHKQGWYLLSDCEKDSLELRHFEFQV